MPPLVTWLEEVRPKRAEVLRYLGHRGQELTDELDARIDAAISRCAELARPRACLDSFDVAERTRTADGVPRIVLEGCALTLDGESIAAHLEQAQAVGIMAVTLGAEIDRELRRLSMTDPLGQLIFDAAATATIECMADEAEIDLANMALKRGLFTTARFSPGYGDLPLECQSTLLAVLETERYLGLTLMPSLLMVPTKSVTAIVGFVERLYADVQLGCSACNLREDCYASKDAATCKRS